MMLSRPNTTLSLSPPRGSVAPGPHLTNGPRAGTRIRIQGEILRMTNDQAKAWGPLQARWLLQVLQPRPGAAALLLACRWAARGCYCHFECRRCNLAFSLTVISDGS